MERSARPLGARGDDPEPLQASKAAPLPSATTKTSHFDSVRMKAPSQRSKSWNGSLGQDCTRDSQLCAILHCATPACVSRWDGRTEERVQILAKIGRPKLCEPKFSASLCGTNK
jgi:hypothetical protein